MGIFDKIISLDDKVEELPVDGIEVEAEKIEAVKKPIKNTFVEFKEGVNKYPAFVKFQRDASKDLEYQVWNELHNTWVGIKEGDMLCISRENDVYPVTKEDFKEAYEIGE